MPEQEQEKNNEKLNKVPPITLNKFLESHAPGQKIVIANCRGTTYSNYISIIMPDIQLHCDQEACNGLRFFEFIKGDNDLYWGEWNEKFFDYRCKNCEENCKRFAVALYPQRENEWYAYKIGEMPSFGPHVPPRVIKLIGPDKDFFLTGRRAESQGMGIGAFTYYRRVVENQKNRILDEVIKVGEKTGLSKGLLNTLKKAKDETQFSKAIDSVKESIPQVLLIDGHNPLILLHSALSEGLHAKSEEECLELARSIRIVLTELATRSGQVLKDQAELKSAVGRLTRIKSGKTIDNKEETTDNSG